MPIKLIYLVLVFLFFNPSYLYAYDIKSVGDNDSKIEFSMMDGLSVAKRLFDDKNYNDAAIILNKIFFKDDDLEIERLFLLGEIAMLNNNWDEAIDCFRKILNINPKISRVRLDLALSYLQKESYYKADYNLRLAMADPLPPEVQYNVNQILYMLRANKNWNLWVNFGIAPDSNINNARDGEQCIATIFGILCNQLPSAKDEVGYNLSFGGNYEFKLSERWRIKNDFAAIISKYNDDIYDDFILLTSIGPRYIFNKGDIWLAATSARRWIAHTPYNTYLGIKLAGNYDITPRLSSYFATYLNPMRYDDFKALDGDSWGFNSSFVYAISSSKYLKIRAGYDRENTADKIYANQRKDFAIGIGIELLYGFSIYLEPSIAYTDYDKKRAYVKDLDFQMIKRGDKTYKYSVTLLNRKINWFGFTPTFGYSYTDRNSNVWQQEYVKHSFNLGITQSF